ncbi:MAG: penicillin-binding protein 2 [Myxococcota bacterium]
MTTLGSSHIAEDRLERGLRWIALCVVAAWIVLVGRLFYLQGVQGDRYRLSAERNSVRTHRIDPPRGMILDRAGRLLVDSRPAFDVLVVPRETESLERTVRRVSRLVGAPPEPAIERVSAVRGRARFRPQPIGTDLSRDALARVESRLWALPGVLTRVRPVRAYLQGDLAAHVLGSLGEISARQLAARRYAGYRAGDSIGRSGVEALLDRELRGRPGGRHLLVDAHGRELQQLGAVEPQPGLNLRLTLDLELQRAAESALDATGHAGAVVALDVHSGEVLVLASRPAFDPNRFASGIAADTWQALLDDPRRPLQNRALQGLYPPGSTFKVVTAIAGLEEGVITPETQLDCEGSLRVGRRRYRCWKRSGHGTIDLHRALVESCDVFFYRVGLEVGVDRIAYYARALGLGRPTGIELPNEKAGLVPTSAWKERRFGEPWMRGETLSIAIGQGFDLWTPLQMASLYATIANGGDLWQPWLIERVETPQGQTVRSGAPHSLGPLPVSSETLALIREALRGAVQEKHGTAGRLRNLPGGIEAAGKTGTAQVVAISRSEESDGEPVPEAERDHAWFVGYAPAAAPEVVVAVLVEHGGHGGSAAVPVARAVLETWIAGRPQIQPGPEPPVTPELQAGAEIQSARD